jgi:hypothetical protein
MNVSPSSSHHYVPSSCGVIKATKRAFMLVLGLIWAVSAVTTSQGYVVSSAALKSAAHRVVTLNPTRQNGAMIPTKSTTTMTNKAFPPTFSSIAAAATASSTTRGGGGGLSDATQVRIARSVVVACTCMATHLLVATKSLHLSPIAASSLVALTVCGANAQLPPATAAAALCGTFAGMSAHIVSSVAAASGTKMYYYCYAAALLVYSALAGLAYNLWDAYQISVGVGGRLGVMALCGNAVYTALFCRSTLVSTLQQMVTSKVLSTKWPWLVAASTAATAMARRWKSASSSQSLVPKLLEQTGKLVLVSLVLLRLLGSPMDRALLAPFVGALAAATMACTMVQRSPGTVVPTALVGLVGSTLVQPLVSALWKGGTLDVAAPLYMGAILGMTAPKKLSKVQFGQAALLATTLLQLSLFGGYGGRLGLFALAGVYFAM